MSKSTIYSELDEISHVIECPDVYMGALKNTSKDLFSYNPQSNIVSFEQGVVFNTGLLKIFDEILTNAADNLQRQDSKISFISVEITNDHISITNNGKTIPIMKNDKNVYIPEMIFTHFRSGSNFRKKNKTTGGKNGIGAKLAAVYSTRFIIDVQIDNHTYHQEVLNNCRNVQPPIIDNQLNSNKSIDSSDYEPEVQQIKITFYPDFDLLRMSSHTITEGNMKVLFKRCHDLTHLNLNITLNGVELPKLTWFDYVSSFNLSDKLFTYINPNQRWKIAFGTNPKKFQCLSYVNNITTYEDGEHVKYILNQIYDYAKSNLPELADITRTQFKNRITLFVYSIIEDPSFTSQAKEKLSSPSNEFGSTCSIPNTLLTDFVELSDITDLLKPKPKTKATVRKGKLTTIEKLVEANKAGTPEGHKCTLFLCEGLSAKTMCDAGIGILGHDYYGCYPLRGKVLNSRNSSDTKYESNRELKDIKDIIGLVDDEEYTPEKIKTLRYGKVVCVKDADSDGAAIMGLVINFFETKFPSLLIIPGFFSEFISPMIKIIYNPNDPRKRNVIPFYNEVEYKRFIETVQDNKFVVEFIKGLATNEAADVKDYFTHYNDNCINIVFEGKYENWLDMAFNKKKADLRKQWLTTITPDTHLPRNKGQPINVIDFVKNDLVLFSYDNCVRSIPSVIDGLKPSQRKILYTLFKMGNKGFSKIKVFQLGGLVAKTANYHHGDQSMNSTIIGMAQNYTGSGNNIPLLQAFGAFGSRTENGDDSGAPRYISAALSKLARMIFPPIDDELTEAKEEDNQLVEPYYYAPIIPMILVNGAKGIGTGWATEIPSYNPLQIISYVKHLLDSSYKTNIVEPYYIDSYYAYFTGEISNDNDTFTYSGTITRKNRRTYIISELPIHYATSKFIDRLNYLCSINEIDINKKSGQTKLKEIEDSAKKLKIDWYPVYPVESFENHASVEKINFKVVFADTIEPEQVMKTLGLRTTIKTTNMVAFDAENKIRRYDDISQIIQEWYEIRYFTYETRRTKQIEKMELDLLILANKCRFIKENIEEIIDVKNKPKREIVQTLNKRKYYKYIASNNSELNNEDDLSDTANDEIGFDYLLNMKIYTLTKEHYDNLTLKHKTLAENLENFRKLTVENIWISELNELENYIRSHALEMGLNN